MNRSLGLSLPGIAVICLVVAAGGSLFFRKRRRISFFHFTQSMKVAGFSVLVGIK